MSYSYKILGQINPDAVSNETLYTVPSGTSAIVSTISICATSGTGSYRISVIPNGESLSTKHYLAYDAGIDSKDSVFLTLGISMAAGDSIGVYANASGLSFSAFGTEII
jgi:hypothetical protein